MYGMDTFIVGVTRMRHGVCIGGIDVATHDWVRPVRRHGEITVDDLACACGHIFGAGDLVRLVFDRPRPDPPHCEDWVWDPAKHPAEYIRRPDDAEQEEL